MINKVFTWLYYFSKYGLASYSCYSVAVKKKKLQKKNKTATFLGGTLRFNFRSNQSHAPIGQNYISHAPIMFRYSL